MRRPSWFAGPDGELAAAREPSAVWAVLLGLAAAVYGLGARLHRALYELGLRRRTRLSCHVVSVGNLDVGGVGKTPLAAWLASGLRARGHRVALASRGYGRLGRERVEVVSDGQHVHSTVERAGDEPFVLVAHAPGVPVLVGPRRDMVGLRALSAFGTQLLVLDDGFQHHRLVRDLDLVLVDGAAGFGNRRLLPRGPLREPLGSLARAQALVVMDGPLRPADEAVVARFAAGIRRFSARRRPAWLRPLAGGARSDPRSLDGCRVGLVSGLARPEGFRRTVEAQGADVVRELRLPDHHRFRADDLDALPLDVETWITTEKDALKILPRWAEGRELLVLGLELEVAQGAELLDWVEGQLRAKPRGRDASLPARGAA